MGAITSLGKDPETLWENLLAGRSGVSAIQSFDVSEFPTKIAASIHDFDPTLYMDKKDARKMDRFVQFSIAASRLALENAKLDVRKDTTPERVGVYVGSGIGGLST